MLQFPSPFKTRPQWSSTSATRQVKTQRVNIPILENTSYSYPQPLFHRNNSATRRPFHFPIKWLNYLFHRDTEYALYISKVAICTLLQATVGLLSPREIVFAEQREGGSETRGRWKEGKVKRTVFIVFRVAGSIDRRTFCFTPFRFDTAQSEKHYPPPSSSLPAWPLLQPPLRQPHSPFTLFLSEILERRRWSTAISLALSSRALYNPWPPPSRRSLAFLRRPDPSGWWLLPFFSFRLRAWRNGEKSRERNERTVGMTWLEGMLLFLPSPSLSLPLFLFDL